ncbi:hypothetical protein BASA60_001336 [Batrachochytrium salamandrivorans]|nr:hypothetical protein BASA60_001336 [Batrachochytrium salamandrivorans]
MFVWACKEQHINQQHSQQSPSLQRHLFTSIASPFNIYSNNITVGARQLSTYKGRKVTPFLYTPSKIVSQRTEAEMPMAATILSTSTMPIAKNTSDTKPPHRKQYQPADAISSMNQGMYNDALGIIKALSQDTSNDLTVLPRGFYEKLISALHFNTDNAFNTLTVTSRFHNLALVHNIIRTWNIPCNLDAFKLILKTYLIQGDFDLTCETYAEIKKRGLDRTDRGVLSLMCRAHIQHVEGKYDMVDGFISEFKLNGGEITLPLYLIQAKVFNLTCNYQATIDLFKEMRLARIKSNSSVYSQEIVAYAGLNNMPMVWKVYSQVEDLITLHKSAAIGMAKMFGSLDGTGTLGNIKAAICLAMLPHNRTLHNLISGYVANGDAESVKLLIHHLHPSRNYSPTASLDHVIWAYYFAGDAIKALAHAKELDSQHTLIDYDVWYATLVCVVKFNPADIDGVVSHIRLKYPNVDIEAELCRAKDHGSLTSSIEGDEMEVHNK